MSEDNKPYKLLSKKSAPINLKSSAAQKHIEKKEIESGRSQIRLASDKLFYGHTPKDSRSGHAPSAYYFEAILENGNSKAVQYHLIDMLPEYDPSGAIIFTMGSKVQVKIEGRNLRPIWEYILEHRLVWIEVLTDEWANYPEDTTIVESIEFTPLDEY